MKLLKKRVWTAPIPHCPETRKIFAKAVFKANPRTIAVLQNGSALSLNWLNDHIPAIIETWYNGEEAGNALADVLFGDFNPGGRLPLTFYKSISLFPSISDYDIRKGRTYMYINSDKSRPMAGEILFPFGYGLSYTTFSYGKLKIADKKVNSNEDILVNIIIKNTGKRSGDEVVQLYVHDENATVQRPEKKLAGFERVTLDPGESRSVEFRISPKELSFWDVKKKAFVIEPGMFKK